MSGEIEIIDIKNQSVTDEVQGLFHFAVKSACEESHRNAKNYIGLETLEGYEAFHIVIDWSGTPEVLAFAGLQSRHFPESVLRALSRTWYSPKIRRKSLKPVRESTFATKDILPLQVQLAKELGKDFIFLSMEFLRRRSAARELATYVGDGWHLLPDMYLTCPNELSANCWQNIVCLDLQAQTAFPLKSLSVDQWRRQFLVQDASK